MWQNNVDGAADLDVSATATGLSLIFDDFVFSPS